MSQQAPAIALVVGVDGAVDDVIYLGIPGVQAPARLHDLFGASGAEKCEAFLRAAREQGVAADWEIPLQTADGLLMSRFNGVMRDDDVVVFGWTANADFYDMYDQLVRINNEQATRLRGAMKSMARMSAERHRDDADFEALTRLTNKVSTIQRELAKKNAELGRLNARKDQLLGAVAHDLRTPLGTIAMFAKMVAKHADGMPKLAAKALGRIESVSLYALSMVEDLLDFAAIESGQITLERAELDVAEFFDETLELVGPLAADKHIVIDVACHGPDIIDADARRVQQVVVNLLTNAVKFSHPGSSVTLSSRSIASGGVAIEVADQGQGIPADQLSKLFIPFSRTSVQSTAGESSTGLGLAISRCIVEAHGGTVHVASEVGVGSRFWVELPAKAPGQVAASGAVRGPR